MPSVKAFSLKVAVKFRQSKTHALELTPFAESPTTSTTRELGSCSLVGRGQRIRLLAAPAGQAHYANVHDTFVGGGLGDVRGWCRGQRPWAICLAQSVITQQKATSSVWEGTTGLTCQAPLRTAVILQQAAGSWLNYLSWNPASSCPRTAAIPDRGPPALPASCLPPAPSHQPCGHARAAASTPSPGPPCGPWNNCSPASIPAPGGEAHTEQAQTALRFHQNLKRLCSKGIFQKKGTRWTSLVVQWRRIYPPNQGTWIPPLV